jgi:hypothetical protein
MEPTIGRGGERSALPCERAHRIKVIEQPADDESDN